MLNSIQEKVDINDTKLTGEPHLLINTKKNTVPYIENRLPI